jgi:hypothetical protein
MRRCQSRVFVFVGLAFLSLWLEMVRCYRVHDRVVGFGHQVINALFLALLNSSHPKHSSLAPA